MAAIQVGIDGNKVLTIDVDGMHLLHVSVHSALDRDAPASLEVHGGSYGDDGSDHRIWIADRILLPGQSVQVSLIDCGGPYDQGHTMAELFPDNHEPEEFDFARTDAWAAELRSCPHLRSAFSMRVETSAGAACRADSHGQSDSFMFMVLWDYTRPSKARLSVRTYCVEDLILRQPGNDLLSETLVLGESATCWVA